MRHHVLVLGGTSARLARRPGAGVDRASTQRRLHPNIIGTPDIHGTWRGLMNSSYAIPATGLARPPRVVYLAIRQTLSTVWVRLLTDESQSDQMAGSIVKDRISEDWLLSYSYRNTPRLPLRKASP
jgi:hypothetical protein